VEPTSGSPQESQRAKSRPTATSSPHSQKGQKMWCALESVPDETLMALSFIGCRSTCAEPATAPPLRASYSGSRPGHAPRAPPRPSGAEKLPHRCAARPRLPSVVSHPLKFWTALVSEQLSWSQASWRASSASLVEPSIRYATALRWVRGVSNCCASQSCSSISVTLPLRVPSLQ
jgi:hypothetical protein